MPILFCLDQQVPSKAHVGMENPKYLLMLHGRVCTCVLSWAVVPMCSPIIPFIRKMIQMTINTNTGREGTFPSLLFLLRCFHFGVNVARMMTNDPTGLELNMSMCLRPIP